MSTHGSARMLERWFGAPSVVEEGLERVPEMAPRVVVATTVAGSTATS